MKIKNYKIKIKKNVIIKENSKKKLNEEILDFTQEVGQVLKSIADEAKMIVKSAQRFINSYIFAFQSTKALIKKDMERLEELNDSFILDDQKLKGDQERLLSMQPGLEDLNKFLYMTSPAVVLVDKFSGIDKADIKRKYDAWKERRKQRLRKNASYAGYLIFLSKICKIVDPSFKEDPDLSNMEKVQSGKFKVSTTSEMIKLSKNEKFKKIIAIFASSKINVNKNSSYKLLTKISYLNKNSYRILVMIHENLSRNDKEIRKILRESSTNLEDIATRLEDEVFVSNLRADIENFDYDSITAATKPQNKPENKSTKKEEESEDDDDKSSNESFVLLKIGKNKLLLEENESENENTKQDTDEDQPTQETPEDIKLSKEYLEIVKKIKNPKEAGLLSILIYRLKRFKLASDFYQNIVEKIENIYNVEENHFESLNKNYQITNIEKPYASFQESINKSNNINNQVPEFNRLFSKRISRLDASKSKEILESYKNTEKTINDELLKSENEYLEKFKDSEEKEKIAEAFKISLSLQTLVEIIKKKNEDNDISDTISLLNETLKFYESLYEKDSDYINNKIPSTNIDKKNNKISAEALIEKNIKWINKNNLDITTSSVKNIDKLYNDTKKSFQDAIEKLNKFSNLFKKEESLKSQIKQNLDFVSKFVDESDENTENKKSDGSYVEVTYIEKESE